MERNNKKLRAAFPLMIALTTIILIIVLFSAWGDSARSKNRIVENGRLALTDWDFEDNGNVKLDGDWEFYWDQIIMPEEFADGAPQLTGVYPVPVYWTKYDGLSLPSKGAATYRLVIDTAREEELLGLSVPELYTEYALYINGQLLVGNGELGSTTFRFLDPDAFMFAPGDNRIEIVLQIRNAAHVNAGIGQSLVLGTPERIFWKDAVETAIDLVLVGICLFAGVYHLVLFLHRRTEYKLLCFTVFCVAVAVRGLISNVTYIMDFFPELPFVIGSRIVTVAIPVLTASMLLYVYFMFRESLSIWIVRALVSVNVLYMVIVLLTEPYIYSSIFI